MSSSPGSVTAVVPLRAGGKTRLGPEVSPGHRTQLARAMLADVCDALREAGVGRVVVAANGAAASAAAEGLDVEVVPDPPTCTGLDAAIAHAAGHLTASGGLLVVAADLPRLRAHDVTRVLDARGTVVIAPTGDGGTGALLRRPADAIPTAYGPDSARRHRRLAAAAGLRCTTVASGGFDDVDTLHDLRGLDERAVGAATRGILPQLVAASRAAG
jgi:2-phospho-L-lactate/phosphoenolpyruvate guanylyltransferase